MSDLPLILLGKTISFATVAACAVALAMSIYPGWLNDLLLLVLLVGLLATPVILVALIVLLTIQYRRGNLRNIEIPWKYVAVTLVLLVATYVALRLYVPRRIAFAAYRPSFQRLVDDGVVDNREFNRTIGPYEIDECLVDDRGGVYFRIYSGMDGIGPDVMSYGFCYQPNEEGSPFGAACYRTFRLGDGWYWFRASDDWF